jgi:succinate dehydrogenase hydrophobic anchor subunit
VIEVVALSGVVLVLVAFIMLAVVLVCQHIDIQSLENRVDSFEARIRGLEKFSRSGKSEP